MPSVLTSGLASTPPLLVTGGLGSMTSPVYGPLIRRAAVAAILADAGLAALVGTNLFPGRVDESVDLTLAPAVTHQVISNVRDQNLSGPSGVSRARIQFSAVGRLALDCEAVAEALRNLFDGYEGVLGGLVTVLETTQLDERDLIESPDDGTALGVYTTSCDYAFRYREPQPVR